MLEPRDKYFLVALLYAMFHWDGESDISRVEIMKYIKEIELIIGRITGTNP